VTQVQILRRVARAYGVTLADLQGRRRHASLAWARHVAAYMVRGLTGASLPEIGALLHRDHTTIMHATRRVARMVDQDAGVRERLGRLVEAIL